MAEFTTEPFRGEGEPPRHAERARDVALAAGLETDFGPLGTTVRGERAAVIGALADVIAAALDSGATRVTLRVEVEPEADESNGE